MRLSLKTMFVLVTAIAVTCVSLLYANPLLADAYYSLCVATIVGGIVAAIARRRGRRVYWMGFVVVGGAYVALTLSSYAPSLSEYAGLLATSRSFDAYSRTHLITTRLLVASHESMGEVAMLGQGGYSAAAYHARFMAFLVIGHSLFALLFGWFGGCLAKRLYRTNGADTAEVGDMKTAAIGD